MLFGLSTFGSKLVVFFLLPYTTRIFNPAKYGVIENLTTTAFFILPVMYMCINEAIIRFGVEKNKNSVYTTGIVTVFMGFTVFLLFMPVFRRLEYLNGFIWVLYIYVLASALRNVTTHFVRASGFTRLFAFDGVMTTTSYVVFVFLFTLKFGWGPHGFILATAASDILSFLFLTIYLRLYRFIKIREFDTATFKTMLRYSVPLIPTAVFWWVTNLSSRLFITNMLSVAHSGIYMITTKLPQIITIISSIFISAWQISIFAEKSEEEQERFFSTVFRSYYCIIMLAASGIILLVRPLTKLIASPEYYSAWESTPFLIIAVSFSCFVTFLGTIYNVAKKNNMVTVTTAVGAGVNLAANYLLIPRLGLKGAALATFTAFFIVFIIRIIDTRKYVKIELDLINMLLSFSLVFGQALISVNNKPYNVLLQALCFVSLAALNFKSILGLLKSGLNMLGIRKRTN